MSNIARILYNDIKLINNYNIIDLINYNNNSLNTILVKYFISIDDNNNIEYFINNNKLMRRDILILIKYYYNDNYNKSLELFNNYIINNINDLDLDFIIDNKLYKFIPYLEGMYLETKIINNKLLDNNLLKYYDLNDIMIDNILDNISQKLSDNILNKLNNFWNNNYLKFNTIIDGGNIIYHDKGNYNINNIDKVINLFNNSLVIIHKKHNYKKNIYYNTNYNYNDDIFILWFFLKSKCKYYIITNDKYKDHIYKYNISNDIYSHLDNKIINYDLSNLDFNIKPNHTRCIQNIYNNNYAIPCINNNFIII